MTVLALTSAKHSPGVTTIALALATAWSDDQDVVLIEADPAGGDLAARMGMPLEPGLTTLAAAGRHRESHLDLHGHSQVLPGGGSLVAAPTTPDRATAAVAAVAARLAQAVRTSGCHGVVDCGRWFASSPATAVLAAADVVVLVLEPTVAGVEHARARADVLATQLHTPVAMLLLGERPYGPREVAEAVGCPVLGAIPIDPSGVAAVHGGAAVGVARRSHLVRSAREVLAKVEALLPASLGVGVGS